MKGETTHDDDASVMNRGRGGFGGGPRGPPQPAGFTVITRVVMVSEKNPRVEVLLQNRKNLNWTFPGGKLPNGPGNDQGKGATEAMVMDQLFASGAPDLDFQKTLSEGVKCFHIYAIKRPGPEQPIPQWFPMPAPSFQDQLVVNQPLLQQFPTQNGYTWVPFLNIQNSNLNTLHGTVKGFIRNHLDAVLTQVFLYYFPSLSQTPGASGGSARKPPLCHHFQRGQCRNGANCKYSHEMGNGSSNPGTINKVCRDWKQGRCTRTNCKFLHSDVGGVAAPVGDANCRMLAQTDANGGMVSSLALVKTESSVFVIGGRPGGICMWEVAGNSISMRGEIPVQEGVNNEVTAVVYEENIKMMFCGIFNKVRYCALGGQPQDLDSRGGQVSALGLSKDDGCVITADESKVISWWQYNNGAFQPLRQSNPAMPSNVRSLHAVKGHTFCGLEDGNIFAWNNSTGQHAGTIPAHADGVGDMVVWNSTHLLSVGLKTGDIKVWRIGNPGEPAPLQQESILYSMEDAVISMELCSFGENYAVMAMMCGKGEVRLISVPKLQPIGKFSNPATPQTRGLALMPGPTENGSPSVMAFAGGSDGHVRCWQVLFSPDA